MHNAGPAVARLVPGMFLQLHSLSDSKPSSHLDEVKKLSLENSHDGMSFQLVQQGRVLFFQCVYIFMYGLRISTPSNREHVQVHALINLKTV